MNQANQPKGLYLHIPYCYDKCSYCDFNSAPIEGARPDDYLTALLHEIDLLPNRFAPTTLFFGGGTPTALATGQLERLLTHLHNAVDLSRVTEFSCEANPGTVNANKLSLLHAHGVNRLSLGAQSFDPIQLKQLGRIHNPDQIGDAVALARSVGFENVSLDLIFALPNQTVADWQASLEAAVALKPDHLSAYCLTYEAGTPLTAAHQRGEVAAASEEEELAMLQQTIAFFTEQGYRRYEISNYARPGLECAHNLLYWRGGSYYGVGAGASSFVDGRRMKNCDDPADYARRIHADGHAIQEEEHLDPAAAFREGVAIGLRLSDGINLSDVAKRTGITFENVYTGGEVDILYSNGLLTRHGDRLTLTERGFELADGVMAELV